MATTTTGGGGDMTHAPSTHEVVLPLFSPLATKAEHPRYRTLVADPPWRYDSKQNKGPQYPTMTHAELMGMGLGLWAQDNAHLWLWTTNAFMKEAHELVKVWGFEMKTIMTWVKGRVEHGRLIQHIGTGNYLRNSTEHVLFAVRGSLATLRSDVPTAFVAPRGEHSEKPATFYDLIETLSPGPFLDVFARTQRFNWDTFGNESFDFREHGLWHPEQSK